jgi:hypothetical protein
MNAGPTAARASGHVPNPEPLDAIVAKCLEAVGG